nr:RHS repeat-associated core domain-containing protein [Bacillus wiedmannii]
MEKKQVKKKWYRYFIQLMVVALIARYYNPDHGVFLSVDPVTMNGYTYADNNPVMMVDPDGHVAWWDRTNIWISFSL